MKDDKSAGGSDNNFIDIVMIQVSTDRGHRSFATDIPGPSGGKSRHNMDRGRINDGGAIKVSKKIDRVITSIDTGNSPLVEEGIIVFTG